jgi:hypothetical protein
MSGTGRSARVVARVGRPLRAHVVDAGAERRPQAERECEGSEDREPDRATLERAAGIAAYHSKARTGGVATVSMAERRRVSKPRGGRISVAWMPNRY